MKQNKIEIAAQCIIKHFGYVRLYLLFIYVKIEVLSLIIITVTFIIFNV